MDAGEGAEGSVDDAGPFAEAGEEGGAAGQGQGVVEGLVDGVQALVGQGGAFGGAQAGPVAEVLVGEEVASGAVQVVVVVAVEELVGQCLQRLPGQAAPGRGVLSQRGQAVLGAVLDQAVEGRTVLSTPAGPPRDSSMSGSGSTPTTERTREAKGRASWPVPHPTSSTTSACDRSNVSSKASKTREGYPRRNFA